MKVQLLLKGSSKAVFLLIYLHISNCDKIHKWTFSQRRIETLHIIEVLIRQKCWRSFLLRNLV